MRPEDGRPVTGSLKPTAWTGAASILQMGTAVVTGLLTLKAGATWLPTDAFGLWTVLYATGAYFALLELGLGQGVARLLAEPVARGDLAAANRLISTGVCIATAQALAVLLVGWFGEPLVLRWANVPPSLVDDAVVLWRCVVLVQAVSLPLVFLQAILWVQNRVYLVYGIGALAAWVGLGALYLGLSLGVGVSAYAWSLSLSSAVSVILITVVLARSGHGLTIRLSDVRREAAREILGFSLTVFVITLAPQLAVVSQSVIAARVGGLEMAAVLAVNTRIGWMLYAVSMRAFDAFIPRWNATSGARGLSAVRSEYVLVGRVTMLAATGAAVVVVLCNRPFIEWWARADLYGGSALTLAVAMTVVSQAITRVWMFPIRLTRHLTPLAGVVVAGLVIELALQWVLASRFGSAGLVAAGPIAAASLLAWFAAREFTRLIEMPWRVVLVSDLRWYGPSLVAAVIFAMWWTPPGSPLRQLILLSLVASGLLLPVARRALALGLSLRATPLPAALDTAWPQ
jgi:O-antigen/teichoic acid export membrane protein